MASFSRRYSFRKFEFLTRQQFRLKNQTFLNLQSLFVEPEPDFPNFDLPSSTGTPENGLIVYVIETSTLLSKEPIIVLWSYFIQGLRTVNDFQIYFCIQRVN